MSISSPSGCSVDEYDHKEDNEDDVETIKTVLKTDGTPATQIGITDGSAEEEPDNDIGKPDVYRIEMEKVRYGRVTASDDVAVAGSVIRLTPVASRGYKLARIRVLDDSGEEVRVTARGNGSYIFVMPDSDVTVVALFEQYELTLSEMIASDILTSDSITARFIRAQLSN